jgi:integrase/recombinase XerD
MLQGIRGCEDGDALIRMQNEQVFIAGDDEVSLGGERASEHVVIVWIAAHRRVKGLGFDDLSQALVVLHELSGGEARGEHPVSKLVASDDLGELGQESGAGTNPLNAYAQSFLEWSAVHGRSPQTIETRSRALKRFIAWCDERDLVHPKDVTLPILERYQRYLYHYRKPNGAPLTFGSQQTMLAPLKGFFRWAARERHLLYNPASELLLPRLPRRLPHHILTVADIESILNQPDLGTPSGVRDRAMLETLYSSGIRRMELVHLCLYDVDTRGGSLTVRAGKGGRDRVVPLGERAAAWLDRYLEEVRPMLITGHDEGVCFLTDFGERFEKNRLGDLVKRYVEGAGLKVIGSCHLFRHAMATHMLENGADIRYIQAILGHNDLDTTAIYTQVSIHKLKAVHANTHPARLHRLTRSGEEPPIPLEGGYEAGTQT